IQCLTDNTNRAVGEIRHLLSKHNGNLGTTNSVAWMFEKHGHIVVEQGTVDEETLMTSAIDAGADDFREDGDTWEIVSSPEAFEAVREAVTAAGARPVSAQVAMLPQNLVKLEGKTAQQMIKLMEVLEDQDDIQHVWSNFDIEAKEIEASLA
ncbi:MAG: YebC/PmpR family DNA-binding transcriptional regulator, partial [Acidobacteria bacterium]|nr:YebC/PmpR family DNA-binding transcriptional regulator [Acidobacteriota bacterium]